MSRQRRLQDLVDGRLVDADTATTNDVRCTRRWTTSQTRTTAFRHTKPPRPRGGAPQRAKGAVKQKEQQPDTHADSGRGARVLVVASRPARVPRAPAGA